MTRDEAIKVYDRCKGHRVTINFGEGREEEYGVLESLTLCSDDSYDFHFANDRRYNASVYSTNIAFIVYVTTRTEVYP